MCTWSLLSSGALEMKICQKIPRKIKRTQCPKKKFFFRQTENIQWQAPKRKNLNNVAILGKLQYKKRTKKS